MNRPPFYPGTAPMQWLRTPRTGHTPAEYACAVERFTSQRSWLWRLLFGGSR